MIIEEVFLDQQSRAYCAVLVNEVIVYLDFEGTHEPN